MEAAKIYETRYALSHDEICKKTTLYPLTLPPEKPEHVTLCHPIGKALAAANNANIQFNLGVVDAQKNINQTKCPTGHTENYCDGWDYQMRWR